MEIKATLQSPFDQIQKNEFIIEQNHKLGYEIREIERQIEEEIEVLEWNIIEVEEERQKIDSETLEPMYDENSNPVMETVIVEKKTPTMVEKTIVNEETGEEEIITVQESHTETITKTVIDLQAWGKTDEEILVVAKEAKQAENISACNAKRYNQEFSVELQEQVCTFDTSEQTQRDLLTASAFVATTGQPYENWVCNNGVVVNLTAEDIQEVFARFFMMVSPLYIVEKQYADAIETCTTKAELDAIELNYEINDEV